MRTLKSVLLNVFIFTTVIFVSNPALAQGPFFEGSVYEPYSRVSRNSPDLIAWATRVESINYGSNVDAQFQTPENALGPASGTVFDIVSLGRGGTIILSFEPPIKNGPEWDLAVFENAFTDTFLELAYVEVSTNGVDFVRFDTVSLTRNPVGAYQEGGMDQTEIYGFAGKYPQGYGTPFDLENLSYKVEVTTGIVDLSRIYYVRIVDIVGDASYFENRPPGWGDNGVIYDPYPTTGSAGFDLEAIGVRYQGEPGVMPGDIDGNGSVDSLDVELALEVLAGGDPETIRFDYSESGADVNEDGRIGMEEVLYILQALQE